MTDRANCLALATKDTNCSASCQGRMCRQYLIGRALGTEDTIDGRTMTNLPGADLDRGRRKLRIMLEEIAQAFGQGEDPLPYRHPGETGGPPDARLSPPCAGRCTRGRSRAPCRSRQSGNHARTPHSGRGPQSRYRRRSRSAWDRIAASRVAYTRDSDL